LSNALEEWAEGKLLLHWTAHTTIPSRQALGLASSAEYIGGLSDFTGEIGRVAVALAARRDLPGVRQIQQAAMVIEQFIAAANVNTNRYSKKLEAVQTNLRKVEDIVYELILAQRSQRVSKLRTGLSLTGPEENPITE
jgi:predicted translin family RNA/ssDNA-binding protein